MNDSKIYALVTYDVTDDKLRKKLAKHICKYGVRVQKSAFEVWISKRNYKQMQKGINGLIDEQKDSVRIYRLPIDCGISLYGKNVVIDKASVQIL